MYDSQLLITSYIITFYIVKFSMAETKSKIKDKKTKHDDSDLKPHTSEPPKSFAQEFRDFIKRGNVVELAVGLTVGAAFTKLVNSAVINLIMPLISIFLSGQTFAKLYISLNGIAYESLEAAEAAKAPVLKYGQLISDLLDFLIIALAIFIAIKVATRLHIAQLPEKK